MNIHNDSESMEGDYAGFISRVMALVIDIVLTNGVVLLVGIGTNWVIDFFTLGGRLGQGDHVTDAGQIVLTVVVVFMALLMNVGYYIALWMFAGRTLGKGVMGLKVVHVRGHSISFSIALRRLIGYYCSAIVLFLGFLWVLVDDDRRGWHDKMAGTCVIYASAPDGSGAMRTRRKERMPSSS